MEERRNIDELIALYSFEDTIRDIFVEGVRDKCFISWFIGLESLQNTEIYTIGDIEVSDEIIDKYGLNRGSNRSRVIATAMELKNSLPLLKNALFIIDRDYNEYLPDIIENDLIKYTDYNSIESYALNEKTICKILSIVYGCYHDKTPKYYFQMKESLRNIFSIRLTNEKLQWSMEWLDFKKYLILKPNVYFDTERFIEAYLKKNSKWSQRDEFISCFKENKKKLNDDCRLSIRGHDFTVMFHYFLNKMFSKKRIDKQELFEGFLLSSLDKDTLSIEPMFEQISDFIER